MRYFGTDGIRGAYGGEFINEDFFGRLGSAVAVRLLGKISGRRPRVAVAGDTRFSSESLKAAFCGGLRGVDVVDFGTVPTPALAFGVLDTASDWGVMVTASHNPSSDNGIKFFDSKALKADDESQSEIERLFDAGAVPHGGAVSVEKLDMKSRYVSKMASVLPANSLAGLRIALDCANGATAGISGEVLRRLGAEVFEIGVSPDGRNINDGVGSEHTERLSALVAEKGAGLGLAHDGDGDRLVVCGADAKQIPGECVLGLIALEAKRAGTLSGGGIVTTLQSNTGLDKAMESAGIRVYRSGIGDRLVMRMMLEKGCSIGGENSGHYIFTEVSPCGDGLAAALKFLSTLWASGMGVSEVAGIVPLRPSLSKAVKVARKVPLESTETLAYAVRSCEARLEGSGRVLVRYSGTENKIRLLLESEDASLLGPMMDELLKSVENDLQ